MHSLTLSHTSTHILLVRCFDFVNIVMTKCANSSQLFITALMCETITSWQISNFFLKKSNSVKKIQKISAKVGTETVGHFSQPNRTHGYHILSGPFRFLPNFFPALLSKRYAGAVVPVRLGGSVFYIEHGSFFPSLCMQGGTNWVAWWLALCWLAAAVLVGRMGHTRWCLAHLLAGALLPCMC